MFEDGVSDPVAKAACEKLLVGCSPKLIAKIIREGRDGAACRALECLEMPDDRDFLLEIATDTKLSLCRRTKAARLLVSDESMKDYKFCPYCGRIADSISYGYLGYYSDMFYYGYSCPCGHENGTPEGYGKAANFAITLGEFLEKPVGWTPEKNG